MTEAAASKLLALQGESGNASVVTLFLLTQKHERFDVISFFQVLVGPQRVAVLSASFRKGSVSGSTYSKLDACCQDNPRAPCNALHP